MANLSGIGLGLGSRLSGGFHAKPPATAYDPNAQSYFDRVEAALGSFDLTADGATYTEEYTKQKTNDLFVSLAPVWSNITQFHLNCAKTGNGINVPAKGESFYTSNFTSGAYNAVDKGSGSSNAIGLATTSGVSQSAGISTAINQAILPPANKDNVTFVQVVSAAGSNFDAGFSYYENFGQQGLFSTNTRYDALQYYYGRSYTELISASTSYQTPAMWEYSNYQGQPRFRKNGSAFGSPGPYMNSTYTGVFGSSGSGWVFNTGSYGSRFPILLIYKNGILPASIKTALKTFLNAFGDTTIQ